MRILIVDDSRAMRMIVRKTLRNAGINATEVKEADNGQQALAALAGWQPDLVLSDWNMPEMTGMELLSTLRARGNRVRFGFVTSEGTTEMRTAAAAAGASFLITKPFTEDAFREAIR